MAYNMKRGNSTVPFKELGSSPAKQSPHFAKPKSELTKEEKKEQRQYFKESRKEEKEHFKRAKKKGVKEGATEATTQIGQNLIKDKKRKLKKSSKQGFAGLLEETKEELRHFEPSTQAKTQYNLNKNIRKGIKTKY